MRTPLEIHFAHTHLKPGRKGAALLLLASESISEDSLSPFLSDDLPALRLERFRVCM